MSESIIKARRDLLGAMRKVAQVKDERFLSVYRSVCQRRDLFVAQSKSIPNRVSYAQKPDLKFNIRNRVRTTLGRYLNRHHYKILYDKGIRNNDLEIFVGEVIADLTKTEESLKLLRGEEIEEAYRNEIGGHSCMTGNQAAYIKLYADNPDRIELLILNDLSARALIWKADDNTRLMDRIYPNSGQHISLYIKWARENNVLIRTTQGLIYDDTYFVHPQTSEYITEKYFITLNPSSNNMYPYMDTFKYGRKNEDENKVILSNIHGDHTVVLTRTNGGWDEDMCCCEGCGENIHENDIRYSANSDLPYCLDCCSICNWCSEYVSNEDFQRIDGYGDVCEYCIENNFCECSECGELVPNDDAEHTVNFGSICISCKEFLYFYCGDCDELANNNDKNEVGNKTVCDDCFTNYRECGGCGSMVLEEQECCEKEED